MYEGADNPSSGVKSAHALRGIRLKLSKMMPVSIFAPKLRVQSHMA